MMLVTKPSGEQTPSSSSSPSSSNNSNNFGVSKKRMSRLSTGLVALGLLIDLAVLPSSPAPLLRWFSFFLVLAGLVLFSLFSSAFSLYAASDMDGGGDNDEMARAGPVLAWLINNSRIGGWLWPAARYAPSKHQLQLDLVRSVFDKDDLPWRVASSSDLQYNLPIILAATRWAPTSMFHLSTRIAMNRLILASQASDCVAQALAFAISTNLVSPEGVSGALFDGNLFFENLLASQPNPGHVVTTPTDLSVYCPFPPALKIKTVAVKKYFSSAYKPMLVSLNCEKLDAPVLLLLKRADVRPDMAVMLAFSYMNHLWTEQRLNVVAPTYNVVAISPNLGAIEFVPNATSLGQINNKTWTESQIAKMASSTAGCMIGGFVLVGFSYSIFGIHFISFCFPPHQQFCY